jgi:chromosomal replication initiation ATPase DnaA
MKIGIFPKLVAIACKEAEVVKSELIGSSRERHVVCARWSLMLGLRRAGLSMPEIGRLIGNRDPSTVLHGLRESAKVRLIDERFDALCCLMENEVDDHSSNVDG